MSNQIYRMNEAEGIFFPAFDKHICDDSQMSMEGEMCIRDSPSSAWTRRHRWF